jgi:hypothetical protein
MKVYRIDDQKREKGVFECVDEADARHWNSLDWGIFFTPNSFNGKRKAENLSRINSWYIDIDKCDKEEVYKKILTSPAYPSVVNETKSGYHVYWFAQNAGPETFGEIEDRLIYHFDADPQVRDVSRLLRVPTYYHCKDKNDRFLITNHIFKKRQYTEREMLFAFKKPPVKEIKVNEYETLTSLEGIDLNRLLKPENIVEGNRNGGIFNKGVFLKKLGLCYSDVERALHWLNQNISNPLPVSEVETIIRGYNSWDK